MTLSSVGFGWFLPGIVPSSVAVGIGGGTVELSDLAEGVTLGAVSNEVACWLTPRNASISNFASGVVVGVAVEVAIVCRVLLLFVALSSAWMVIVVIVEEDKTDTTIVEGTERGGVWFGTLEGMAVAVNEGKFDFFDCTPIVLRPKLSKVDDGISRSGGPVLFVSMLAS
jgi:hypothetical protein